jgi:hypothetical protein
MFRLFWPPGRTSKTSHRRSLTLQNTDLQEETSIMEVKSDAYRKYDHKAAGNAYDNDGKGAKGAAI